MWKRTFISLALLLLLIAGLGGIKYRQIQEGMAMMAASVPPPAMVEVTHAKRMNWQPHVTTVGTLTAREGIDVTTEVEGVVETIHIKSGQRVNQGDLLITLNDDVEQAELERLKAQEELALRLFERMQKLWKQNAMSETEYDQATSNFKVVQANLLATKARIAKKTIRAPFSGILGISHANTGQYVSPGMALVVLQDYSVLYADFAIAERFFPDVREGLMVNFRVSAYPDRVFNGEVVAIDAKVDETTRNINVRAQLDNQQNLLRPGMYAEINLVLNKPSEHIVVPVTAIVFSSFGDALFVADKNDQGHLVAQRVTVTTGEQRGDQIAILSGLQGGEQVVQAGVSKLRNNAPIAISEQPRLKN